MSLPRTRTEVEENKIDEIVEAMELNPDVGSVEVIKQPNGKYTIIPKPA